MVSRSNPRYQKSLCTQRKPARACGVISAMTSPRYPLCGCSDWLRRAALISLFVSWKVAPIWSHFNLPPSVFRHRCADTKTLQGIDALPLGWWSAARLTRWRAHPSGGWAISSFSQRRLSSSSSPLSARLGSLCWCAPVQQEDNSQSREHMLRHQRGGEEGPWSLRDRSCSEEGKETPAASAGELSCMNASPVFWSLYPNAFVTLQISQMRSMSVFLRCAVGLPRGFHTPLVLCMSDD